MAKMKLEEQLVGRAPVLEPRVPILGPDLAELARPVGEDERASLVGDSRFVGVVGVVESSAGEPAARELILEVAVGAESIHRGPETLAAAPHELGPPEEMGVDGAPQGPVAERRVGPKEAGRRGVGRAIVPVSDGTAEVDVDGLREVLVSAEVPHVGRGRPAAGAAKISRLAAEDLAGRLQEEPGVRDQVGDRDPGVGHAVFAAEETLAHEGPVDEGKDVVVLGVDLAEGVAHLPRLQEKAAREGGKGDERLLDADLFGAEGEKEVPARVGIDHRLKRELGLVHLEGRLASTRALARGPNEVADGGHVGVEDLRRGRRATVHGE